MGVTVLSGKIQSKEVVLLRYLKGWPRDEDFEVRSVELEVQLQNLGDIFVETLWVSVDPYMRMRMNSETEGLYMPRFEIGKPIQAFAIAKVVQSTNAMYPVESYVHGVLPVAEYMMLPQGKNAFGQSLHKLPDETSVPLTYYLGILGMPGLTGWLGLYRIANLKREEQVFISAAAGAVGLTVGQLAKLKGCRIVGSAGADEKVKLLIEEFAFDDAFNYKSETDWDTTLREKFPKGIDVYFENVGGRMLEAVLNNMNSHGRIPACGMVSQYNQDWREREGVRNLMNIVGKSVKMEGFLVTEYFHMFEEFWREMLSSIKDGKIKYKVHITEGLEGFSKAFVGMLRGEKIGKALIHVRDP